MISFANDYSEGCLPEIMEALQQTNLLQTTGYGMDEYCERARKAIQETLADRDERTDIHFAVGGTQANLIVISHLLRPHQGVISAPTGHIAVHESGAIEAAGHKVLELRADPVSGKLTGQALNAYMDRFWEDPTCEHMVQPGMVYLSNATELGVHNTLAELRELRDVADQFELPLFLDGARLGSALLAAGDQLDMADLLDLVDVFTIGGTKNGTLFGEAVVFTNRRQNWSKDFRWILKQRGGMLAKGRLLGVQFETLFRDGLFFRAAARANQMADRLRAGFSERCVPLWVDNCTNQVFVSVKPEQKAELARRFEFETWAAVDEHNLQRLGLSGPHDVIRLCTSWATQPEAVAEWFEAWDETAGQRA